MMRSTEVFGKILELSQCFQEIQSKSFNLEEGLITLYGARSSWVKIRIEFEGYYLTHSANDDILFYRDAEPLLADLPGEIRGRLT
jgi:hypothetical protein